MLRVRVMILREYEYILDNFNTVDFRRDYMGMVTLVMETS